MRIELGKYEVAAADNVRGTATSPCPGCGQSLILPTDDLCRSYRCPRCHSDHLAGDLIGFSTPIAAIPLNDVSTGKMNPWARTLVMPRSSGGSDVSIASKPWSTTLTMHRVAAERASAEDRLMTPQWRPTPAPRKALSVSRLKPRIVAALATVAPFVHAAASRLKRIGRALEAIATEARSKLSRSRKTKRRRIIG